MPTSRIRFRPGLVPTLATLLLLPTLIALGFWQLDRARAARALQAQIDAHARETAIVIGRKLLRPGELRYSRIIARGYYDARHQFLLDNQVHNGFAGYDVITPMRIAGSDTRILVNRGWIPMGANRTHLPPVATPRGEQVVAGVAMIPDAHYFTLAHPRPISGKWPPVWENLDMRRFRRAVPFPVQPAVVLLDPHSPAGGFVRKWPRYDTGIAMHQSYAGQWFLLAAALLVIYVWVNVKRVPVDS
ncbi:MAG: SURF1 family protein [Gammaproteobacteria bacterium]|nr:SURF1 family protein [Gammaproteobacteria bacterium]